ncbi:MAG: hypothetical protein ACJ72A_02765 [Nocardioidaceae bacterium]
MAVFRRAHRRREPQPRSADLAVAMEVADRFDAAWGTQRPLDSHPNTTLTVPDCNAGPSIRELCGAVLARVTERRLLLVTESWSRSRPDRPTRFLTQARWRVCEAWGGPERDYRISTLYVSWVHLGGSDLERVLDLAVDDSIAVHLIPEHVRWLVTPHFDRIEVTALTVDHITRFEHAAVAEGGSYSR